MYGLIGPLLFQLEPEVAHKASLNLLHFVPGFCFSKPKEVPVKALGRQFLHPIGLAAGLDKNAEHLDALARLGFSFIEVGTVTPRPQLGNSKPRLFRLPQAEAIINRMGFNNLGVDVLVRNIQRANYTGILGINIGKNKDTSLDHAIDDYLHCFKKIASYASYVTINISSPNTPDLRQLQQSEYFTQLIKAIDHERQRQVDKQQRDIPLVVKVSPDESNEHLKEMADLAVAHGIDGIIATNTTCSRDKVKGLPHAEEAGGLSGSPLADRATECLYLIRSVVGNSLTLIASGGIDNPKVAREKIAAGADLLQLYTGLIYKGPALIHQLIKGLD